MKLIKHLLLLSLVTIIFAGCTPPVTYVIDLAYAPSLKEEVNARQEKGRIAIVPFEDLRAEKGLIGTRMRFSGKVDKFAAYPYPVSIAVTQTIVRALKIKGYETEILKEGTEPESIQQSPPRIIISGKIEELWADGMAKIGYTGVKVNIRLKLKVYKVDEKESYTINIQSQSEPKVVIFTPSEMQRMINDTLTDAIDHVITNQWKER